MSNETKEIANKYLLNRLSLDLLSNISEIATEYKHKQEFEKVIQFEHIEDILSNTRDITLNLKEILSLHLQEKSSYINKLEIYKENIANITKQILAEIEFAQIVQTLYLNKIKVLTDIENLNYEPELLLSEISDEIEENGLNNAHYILYSIPCNMIKDEYTNYIKESVKGIYKGIGKEVAKCKTESLKLKFAPYLYIEDEEKKKYLLELLINEQNKDDIDFIEESIDEIENIIWDNLDIIGTFDVIYSNMEALLNILKYAGSLEELFQDDFVFKDLYYYVCERAKEKDFEALDDEIDEKCTDKIFTLEKENTVLFKKIQNVKDEFVSICKLLEQEDKLDFEEKIFYVSIKNNSEKIKDEEIEQEANKLVEFINNLDIDYRAKKKLKQNFFLSMPCYISDKELFRILENILYNLEEKQGLLAFYRIYSQIKPDELLDTYEDLDFSDEEFEEYLKKF